MLAQLAPWRGALPAIDDAQQAEVLRGILAHNPDVQPAQRAALVQSVMRPYPAHLAPLPSAATIGSILLRPGVVQAAALGVNYGIVLGLDMSGTLQYSDLPAQAVLVGMNYLVLTGLMTSLSVLCLVHAFVKMNFRPAYRALLVAMGATGLFGMMETFALNAPPQYSPMILLLFVVTVPLISLFVALYSIAQGIAELTERTQPVPVLAADQGDLPRLPRA